ncbi:OadG-related small transporter subunit [Peptoniphilus mikwangii]|nr:OadG-related small transporter subunit [Peptoniphilus mikwangii]
MNTNFLISLEIMVKGMLAIFVVLGILALIVALMCRIFNN